MKKEQKGVIIAQIAETVKSYPHFYLTDAEALNAEQTSNLRKACYKEGIKLLVVKNTLLIKALDSLEADYSPLYPVIKRNTAVMFSEQGNVPAKLLKEYARKGAKPSLKGAYVEESFFVGAEQLDALVALKSKNELIGDVIGLLQSPAKNVISALQSGGTTIHGILKTLSEK